MPERWDEWRLVALVLNLDDAINTVFRAGRKPIDFIMCIKAEKTRATIDRMGVPLILGGVGGRIQDRLPLWDGRLTRLWLVLW